MAMVISKSLALELFPEDKQTKFNNIQYIKHIPYSDTVICIEYELFDSKGNHSGWRPRGANSYEIAHLLKEWAFNNGWMHREKKCVDGRYEHIAVCFNGFISPDFERIEHLCQWILEGKVK